MPVNNPRSGMTSQLGVSDGPGTARVVYFSQDDEQIVSRLRFRVRREPSGHDAMTNSQSADVESRQDSEIGDVGRSEEAHVVEARKLRKACGARMAMTRRNN